MVFVSVLIDLKYFKFIEFILQLVMPMTCKLQHNHAFNNQKIVINNGNMVNII